MTRQRSHAHRAAAGAALLAAALVGTATARAQSSGEARGAEPGRFDFYVLALSWSPGFCAREAARDRDQCAPGRRLGFVIHGLWPQYERGYPADCDGSRGGPPRMALDAARDLYPSEQLARHEWRRHGTCSGETPAAYFRAVRTARERVRIPDPFERMSADGRIDARTVERAFAAANPGLRPDMMAVSCRRGALEEVRICLDKDLRGFRRCPEIDRRGCGFGDIRVDTPR